MPSRSPAQPGTKVPGFVVALVAVAVVAALPLLAHRYDGSADEFSGHHFAILPALGWLLLAALTAVVVTRLLQLEIAIKEGSALALAYDALPVLLVAAWIIGILAALTGHILLMVAAAGLCLYHVILVVPRWMSAPTPAWVRRAPRLRLVVANVFVDNETPSGAARQLVASGGDVVVIVESTAEFMRVFDDNGGAEAYPQRIIDPHDRSDYAVAVVAKRTLGPRTKFLRIGALRLAIADVDVDGTSTLIVALNPMATMDTGGHEIWKEQLKDLADFVPTLSGPVVIAGDLNATRYRPEFEQILALGYVDAIDSLGKGMKPSFKLNAQGALGALGPIVRLDHALSSADVHPLSMNNLEPCGSDHVPFAIEFAVRQGRTPRQRGTPVGDPSHRSELSA